MFPPPNTSFSVAFVILIVAFPVTLAILPPPYIEPLTLPLLIFTNVLPSIFATSPSDPPKIDPFIVPLLIVKLVSMAILI